MSRQDRQGVRTPADVERKYNLGKVASSQGLSEKQKMQLDQLNQTLTQFMASTNAKFEQLGNNPGGGASVQSDHAQNDPTQPDYIKNRLAWTEPPSLSANWTPPLTFDEITWDGITGNRPCVELPTGLKFYKISDQVLTLDDIIGSTVTFVDTRGYEFQMTVTDEDASSVLIHNDRDTLVTLYICSFSDLGIIPILMNGESVDLDVPEKGTYLVYSPDTLGGYVGGISGNIDKDAMDVFVADIDGMSVYMNKVSDSVPDAHTLIGMSLGMVTEYEGGVHNITTTVDSDLLSTGLFVFDDGSYALVIDDMPFVFCMKTAGYTYDFAGISVPVDEEGLYFTLFLMDGVRVYTTSLSGTEIVHKIDPKYLDLSDVKADDEVIESSDKPVSGKAVFTFVSDKLDPLSSKINETDASVAQVETRVIELENKKLPLSQHIAVNGGIVSYSEFVSDYYNFGTFYTEPKIYDFFYEIARIRCYKISDEEFYPEQVAKVNYKESAEADYSKFGIRDLYENGSFTSEKNNLIYLSGKDIVTFQKEGTYEGENYTFHFKLLPENIDRGLYLVRCYNYPAKQGYDYVILDDVYEIENIYGYDKLDSLYVNVETDVNANSSTPPTSRAVKKAITALEQAVYKKTEVDSMLTRVYKYRGTVPNYSDLPTENNVDGDVWNITYADKENGINAGDNVAWNEDNETWDVLAGTVDLSDYATNKSVATVQGNVDSVVKNVQDLSNSKLDASKVGVAEGTASLDKNGLVPKEQIPPEMRDIVTYGYFREALSLFYEDEYFVKPIAGELGKFYLGKGDKPILYVFDGQKFVPLSGVGGSSEDDYLTDEEYEEIMGGMGI